jgi:hypothetical protein
MIPWLCINVNANQIMQFDIGSRVNVRESSYTQVIFGYNTIPSNINTFLFYRGMKIIAWYIYLNDITQKRRS